MVHNLSTTKNTMKFYNVYNPVNYTNKGNLC